MRFPHWDTIEHRELIRPRSVRICGHQRTGDLQHYQFIHIYQSRMKVPSRLSSSSFLLLLLGKAADAWLPAADKIRGVNLGGQFIIEPWMMGDAWNAMGCGGQQSEFDCVSHLGQTAANAAFQNHWNTWITQDDIRQIASLNLNTIRIPVGYWIKEDLGKLS